MAKKFPKAIEKIPEHLLPFVVDQDPALYTPIDHASWRYILRLSRDFFEKNAHPKYLNGLKETGISTERIPLIEEMDACLKKFGWRAVAVSGFIPPAVFMEFQSLGILPIACDMRKLEHMAYTPAPDIVHEAAGHAPIISDPDNSTFLRRFGEINRKAIFTQKDMNVYLGIRNLSEVKEDPKSTESEIQAAYARLEKTVSDNSYVSEATQLARLAWWTIEYGLIGKTNAPLIYGAGLLSSVGESFHCLSDEVQKIPFSSDCMNMSYDITRPQPQLYVTPNFETLTEVLENYAKTMAFQTGGRSALAKARTAESWVTVVYDSGIQIAGVLKECVTDPQNDEICYLRFIGPTQLCLEEKELENQGADYHKEGFGSPFGPLENGRSPADLNDTDLKKLGFDSGKPGKLRFQSGVEIVGILKDKVKDDGKNLLLIFENCKVTLGNHILFDPSWGTYDMACGKSVISVYGGVADRSAYRRVTGEPKALQTQQKTNFEKKDEELYSLYQELRNLREKKTSKVDSYTEIFEKIKKYPDHWLIRMELLEVNHLFQLKAPWEKTILKEVQDIRQKNEEVRSLIDRGLVLLYGESL